MTTYDVVIVGGGHGGAQAALALRQFGFVGSIALFSSDPNIPYERPPLSKDYLLGGKSFDRMLIRPEGFWDERQIHLRLGQSVVGVDPVARSLVTASGELVNYGKLIWAAGGQTRTLSCAGHDLAGVHSLRTRSDADDLISEIPGAETAVIVGAGYIGLEAAAALVQLGKRVILLESQDRVLARVAAEPLSRFLEEMHRRHGVDLRLGSEVDCIVGHDRVSGVQLRSGDTIPCQLVIVGIGITPVIGPLSAAGATVGNGVLVDECCRTSLADVFAIGDCALHPNRFSAAEHVRIESVQNATDQATIAAKCVVGIEARYEAMPWFWSNQYDMKLQTVGLSGGYDDVVVRGDPGTASFSVIYLRTEEVIAVDCVNSTKDFVQARKLISSRKKVQKALLARSDLKLGDLALQS